MLLKLLIHEFHPNKLNLFNQVAIIAVNCLGEPYPTGDQTIQRPLLLGGRFEEDLKYDTSTVEKLRGLEVSKKEAVT